MFAELWRKLGFFFRREKFHHELEEEMQHHLAMKRQAQAEKGASSEEARFAAQREFGNTLLLRERSRDMWGFAWLENLLQDLRYGMRMLRKSPGFTAVAILTLALGIGANTAIFSVINAVLLRNLPVKDPQQLVLFQWDHNKWPPMFGQTGWDSKYSFSYPAFDALRTQKKALAGIFAFVPLGFNDQNTTVGINGRPTLADGMMVTGEYFSTLGVTPLLGRGLTQADENPGAPRAVVISYIYWTRRFARDPSIIGKSVTLNGIPFTIVGVTPANFYGISVGTEPDLWVPFDDKPNMRPWSVPAKGGANSVYTARNWLCLNIMGRLKNGVTKAQAQSAFDAVFHQFVTADWHPAKPEDVPHFMLASGSQGLPVLQQGFQQPLYMLMIAVGLVLLIACANVATLLLARATTRQKEISVRLAIGASRPRLIRQLLTESILMSMLGGLLGLAFADWGTRALIALISQANNGTMVLDAGTDSQVLLFMFIVAVLTGILFGLAPALRASKVDLASAMKDSATNLSGARDKHRLGQSLIVAQVAASLVLMIGAGLFVRTLVNFENRNFGFDQRNLLTFGLDPTRAGYHDARLVNFYSQLLDRIQALPGVRAATLMSYAPFSSWSNNTSVSIEGVSKGPGTSIRWQSVGPDFFSTMGIRIVLGRGIARTDTAASPHVAVVDETFAKKYFPGQTPVGHRFSLGTRYDPKDSFEIVGVCRPAELTDPTANLMPKGYMAYAQDPKGLVEMFFEVRSEGPPASVISELRDAVNQADASLALINLKTQKEETSEALAFQRLFARLTTVFGLLALLLAMIGLYGTMAYSVTRKTHEIGIRMALGAKPADVLAVTVRQGITLTLIGVAIGVVAALGVTRLVSSMIYGITPYDPVTFVAVAAILVVVALLACYIPARRAMRVDPMIALRYE
ncbi:MAG TPA: ABC transporter permease [Candidatus Acidoferrales bacterium]|nr:ABC transporter permease [Candidatus Acidoferrales bacterium]